MYLENAGGMKFRASTFAQCIAGRWMTMAAGDVDRDGDIDLVLGSMTGMPDPVPGALKNYWEKQGPPVLILKNELRRLGAK